MSYSLRRRKKRFTAVRTMLAGAAVLLLFLAIVGLPPFPHTHDARGLLQPGYSNFETGLRRRANGVLEVAVLTHLHGVSPEMVRWWFTDHLQTADQFKDWYSRGHAWMAWEDKFPGRIIGAAMQSRELIGGRMLELRTSFLDPSEFFGGDPTDDNTFALCAATGPIDNTETDIRLCHLVRAVEGGSEVRSRLWLGHTVSREGVGPADFFSNTAMVRYLTTDKTFALALLAHVSGQMSAFPGFLPELYEARPKDQDAVTRQ